MLSNKTSFIMKNDVFITDSFKNVAADIETAYVCYLYRNRKCIKFHNFSKLPLKK